ncbi:hypothetical protein SLEP1_g28682 [Rubroshorea leprosula]|uniref:Uncharacterized protein n=1 Tax=Rubroshorea leprosula TaxID=152421 RepID=A0AAV5K3W8_9ROSI|nr:hypothetical protein SLEP1_g28682 [Rubroshorea leprosula]
MSRNPTGSTRRRSSSSGLQEQHNLNHPQLFTDNGVAPDIQQTIDPLMDYNFAPNHENEGPSSSTGNKGWSRNLKGICPPENRESRKWVKLTNDNDKLQFADPNIPRAITSLWKSRFDGMDEKLKWNKNSAYVPCWIPTHIWPQLLTYWDSDEYKRLSARGAKNRSSGERVTHTTGFISFGIHEMRMTKSRGEAQNNLNQTIAQSVAAALAAHGISPQVGHHPVAPPQPSHGPCSSLHMNSTFTYSTDSTQTFPMVPKYQQQRQFPP